MMSAMATELRALVVTFAVAGCTPHLPPEPRPASGPPLDDTTTPGNCGAQSYGVHRRSGDTLETIAQRQAGTITCATPCDPTPAFATRALARNEHGGYGSLELDADPCQFPGMNASIARCHATCEAHDRLGRIDVDTQPADDTARATLCLAFTAQRGPPGVGSCDCLADDIVWLPTPTLAGVVLRFNGTYTLECGFPEANYTHTRPLR